jgi:hypothetical protein
MGHVRVDRYRRREVRVRDILAPRRTTRDAVRTSIPWLQGVSALVQERAWTSPIRCMPSGT